MPHILLLRLSAPMQSWGIMSRFSRRDTGKEPSKSGVIGILCAALGISREEADTKNPLFNELTKLKMGVVVLREGVLLSDYHTAQNIAKAAGGIKETELSTRFYLSDADFVVVLAGENRETLEIVQKALQNPKWQLFLGRKSFPPDFPVYYREGVMTTDKTLEDFLQGDELKKILDKYEKEFGELYKFQNSRRRIIFENDSGSESRPDAPLSFAARRFTNRRVKTKLIKPENGGENEGNLSDEDDFESAF